MKKLLFKIDSYIIKFFDLATSTRAALYILIVMVLIANIKQPPTDLAAFMLVVVSEFYQGSALPALGISQKTEATKTRTLLQETHDMVMQEMAEIRKIHEGNQQELAEIKEILNFLKKG